MTSSHQNGGRFSEVRIGTQEKWRPVLGSADLSVGIVLLKSLGKLDLSVAFTRVLGMECSRAAALTRIGVCVCVCVCVYLNQACHKFKLTHLNSNV